MPTYEYHCPNGHVFDKLAPMADRNEPQPCEGLIDNIATDDEIKAWRNKKSPEDGIHFKVPLAGTDDMMVIRRLPCSLTAQMQITHGSPKSMINHRLGANRDAAREGRYDPLKPIQAINKGHSWRE